MDAVKSEIGHSNDYTTMLTMIAPKLLPQVYDKNMLMAVKLRRVVKELEKAERKSYICLTNRIHEAKQQAYQLSQDKRNQR